MNIGFDINEANVGQRVGVNQVAWELFRHLVEVNKKHKIIAFSKQRPLPDFPVPSQLLSYETFGPQRAWVLTGLTKRLLLGRPKIDILFSPSHYTPLLSFTPAVIDIMDLSYERFDSDYFTNYDLNQLKRWTKRSANKAKHIITISNFSKQEIHKLYKVPLSKISVIYPGIDNKLFQPKVPLTKQTQVRKKFNIKGPYFVSIGTLQPRKNIARLIDAFNQLVVSSKPRTGRLKLVIVGKKGWLFQDIFEKVKAKKLENRVIFTGFAPSEDLPALLKASTAYVLPSLYEGFGIPVLEAQATGTPVIISRNSSLPEIAGPSAVFIDKPKSAANIAEKLLTVLALSKKQRQKIIFTGKQNVARFSWEKSAIQLLSLLESLAK